MHTTFKHSKYKKRDADGNCKRKVIGIDDVPDNVSFTGNNRGQGTRVTYLNTEGG